MRAPPLRLLGILVCAAWLAPRPAAAGLGGDWWSACTAEREKFCAGIEAGGGRVAECINGHRSELSGTCRAALTGDPGAAAPQETAADAPVSAKQRRSRKTRPAAVDHVNFSAIDSASAAETKKLAAFSAFFAHASVGDNIISGMAALHAAQPAKFPLSVAAAGGSAPGRPGHGVIYHVNRGNPGWSGKIEDFGRRVRGGWHAPAVQAVMTKFCFIDQDAGLSEYLSSMSDLEKEYPGTVFIYVTMPLARQNGPAARKRGAFNEGLRAWTAANRKVLFDLADIEAWSPDGADCGGLCVDYTSDGGHLNSAGQRRAAKGLYSLFLSLRKK